MNNNNNMKTLPRFVFLPKPNPISNTEDVILMRADDFEKECWKKGHPESQYITNKLEGFFLFSDIDFNEINWREPTEQEISQFAIDAINRYRSTEKARELLSTLKASLKDN